MNWDAIGAIGEIIGAAAVVMSLLYLAIQMRQSNRLVERAIVKELLADRAEYNRFVSSDAELNSLYWKGMNTPDQLSESEWLRYLNMYAPMARQLEAVYLDISNGFLSESRSTTELISMQRWLAQPGPQKYFTELGDGFDPAFMEVVIKIGQDQD